MPLKNIPIRRKLIVIILATTVAALLLQRAVFFGYEFLTFRKATYQHLSIVGDVIAANSTAALAFDNQDDAAEVLAALKAEPNIKAAALYDKSGKLFAKYPSTLPDSSLPSASEDKKYHFENLSLVGFQPVIQGESRLGMLYLQLSLKEVTWNWFFNSIVIAIVVLSFAVFVAYFISRKLQQQISGPILALADMAKAVSERGDYSVRATRSGTDELGSLTDAFNQMLTQIQEQNQALQKMNVGLEQSVQDRTAQLEAANKELEAFSYSVSHDLRAPLRHISGFVELLSKHAGEGLNDKSRRYLKIIAETGEGMGQLIDDLLSFSRIGKTEMHLTTVNLNQLVQDTMAGLKPETDGRNIVWNIQPLPSVQGDASMLKQVFVNLISNSVKYSRPRDPARIDIECRDESTGRDTIVIRDNGVGFDMKYVDKLFGVFQRLHSAEEFEGTGVGLANVRRIVSRHGGRIWAEGKVDEGATFFFTLTKTK
ncbi:MAG TPA: ATP-binding protein [Verrucomicrobiae bacterium]|nr:ATP-binding protein [Verrucomicrobiae bacterium]